MENTNATVKELSFEKIDTSGGGAVDGVFFLSMTLAILGLVSLFRATSVAGTAVGAVTIASAGLLFWRLFYVTPKTKYYRYFWLSEFGVHHKEDSSPTSRVSRFSWSEIKKIELVDPNIEDVSGIKLFLNRPGLNEVPIYLGMANADAEQAVKSIRQILAELAQPVAK